MGIYLAEQTVAFLYAILVGAGAGLLYDFFRISRIALPTPKAIVFAEDVLYFLICAAVTFLLMMLSLDGKVRAFLLAGELIGAILYFLTLGQLVMRLAEAIIRIIKGILHFIYRYILYPIYLILRKIVSLLLRPAFFFAKILKKIIIRCKFRLKMNRVLLYNQYKQFLSGEKKTHAKDTQNQKT